VSLREIILPCFKSKKRGFKRTSEAPV